ncbi:MAG: isoleucine--tRNA ligase [Firmicutes bacterium]|nr:isoleucine--tRNA ligase [Bacillota bacterium]
MIMDYRDTLNLPQTEFPMRANLPNREPEMLEHWAKLDLNKLALENRSEAPLYILHDGPPYANGDIHMGTALNKVLKDIINKYKTMKGFKCPYIPGWDTHGLPIEHQIIKTKKVNRKEISDLEFRRMCHEYALQYVDIQRNQFKRLGVRGDWDNPYLTLVPEFEGRQIKVFGKMAERGFIYKGMRPVYWCATCETALAEAEIEYGNKVSDSIYVKFPLADDKGLLDGIENTYCLIWTTTAWTIPANLAIAVHADFDYVLVDAGGEKYLLAEELVEAVAKAADAEKPWTVLKHYKGSDLVGMRCRHPLYERDSVLLIGDHVTLEQGTGCVHIAPGHGHEDFEIGRANDLPVLSPLDDRGYYTAEAGQYEGMRYDEGGKAVINDLREEGALLKSTKFEHQYPNCWRCKQPVLYRATEQWFASIDGFRKDALEAIKKVHWTPSWGEERISNMIAERQDWCISRQRVWGVPIPIFYCDKCNEPIINEETINIVSDLFSREGSDAWYAHEASEILPESYTCPACGYGEFRKEKDTMDVWFDSGSSHAAVLETRPELRWPADLYLEGSDQYRGWFHSSLLTAVATKGEPPYKAVLSHGWVVDGEGKKMSKSLGNVIAPEKIIKQYGADILRLWVSSADFTSDIHLSQDILGQLIEVYRKIRNTIRFMLGSCSDFDPDTQSVEYDSMEELDRWALYRLNLLVDKVTRAYEKYEYHQFFHALHNFCVVDMSNLYLDIIKDRLYCSLPDDRARRSAQTALMIIMERLVLLMAPILTFTADEIWQHLPGRHRESVQLADWPEQIPAWNNAELGKRWKVLLEAREEVTWALEQARKDKIIGGSLEAAVTVWTDGEVYDLLKEYSEMLPTLFIVSTAGVIEDRAKAPAAALQGQRWPVSVLIEKSAGHKCPRCWIFTDSEEELCPRCSAVVAAL